MGIVKSLMNNIDGIFWVPLISLGLFFSLFSVMVIHALSMSKKRDRELGRMPLDNDEQ